MSASIIRLYNGTSVPRRDIPELPVDGFLRHILEATDHGWRVSAYFGMQDGDGCHLYCLLASKAEGVLGLTGTRVPADDTLPSIASLCPQVALFEREIAEQCGLAIDGHPWLKPVRFQRPLFSRPGEGVPEDKEPGVMDFYQVQGDEIHEVAVGPVHAGIIEPGHSGSSATANRCSTWRFPWAISIAVSRNS